MAWILLGAIKFSQHILDLLSILSTSEVGEGGQGNSFRNRVTRQEFPFLNLVLGCWLTIVKDQARIDV